MVPLLQIEQAPSPALVAYLMGRVIASAVFFRAALRGGRLTEDDLAILAAGLQLSGDFVPRGFLGGYDEYAFDDE